MELCFHVLGSPTWKVGVYCNIVTIVLNTSLAPDVELLRMMVDSLGSGLRKTLSWKIAKVGSGHSHLGQWRSLAEQRYEAFPNQHMVELENVQVFLLSNDD